MVRYCGRGGACCWLRWVLVGELCSCGFDVVVEVVGLGALDTVGVHQQEKIPFHSKLSPDVILKYWSAAMEKNTLFSSGGARPLELIMLGLVS